VNNADIVKFIETAEADRANVYVDKNTGIATSEFYRTEITRLDFDINIDFHRLESKEYNEQSRKWEVNEAKVVYAPKVSVLDRIADCAGITFVNNETKEVMHDDEYGKHTAYVSHCIGRKLMSDGNYKDSSLQIYEFDPLIQAMSENTDDAKIRRKTLEYRKNAAKRAETGARLRVIRELAGLPQGFPKERAEKYFVIGRTVPNLKEIASTERGRALAECKALGIDPALLLYGERREQRLLPAQDASVAPVASLTPTTDESPARNKADDITPDNNIANLAAEAAADGEPDFPKDDEEETPQEETEFDRLTFTLDEYMSFKEYLDVTTKSGANPYELAQAELNSKTATEESRRKMIDRLRDFLIAKNVPGVA
jgi:hypothetical protein